MSPSAGAEVSVTYPKITSTTLSLSAWGKQIYRATSRVVATATVAQVDRQNPRGYMAFYIGTPRVATVQINSAGVARYTYPSLTAAGKKPVTARILHSYKGYSQSTSKASTLIVAKAKAKATVALPSATVKKSKKAVVIVNVRVPGVAAPTGVIAAYSGSTKPASYTLTTANKGKLAISLPKFSKTGAKTISVRHLGAANINADASPAAKLKIE